MINQQLLGDERFSEWRNQPVLRQLIALQNKGELRVEGRALDVGCGAGRGGYFLRLLGAAEVYGLDLDHSAITDPAKQLGLYEQIFFGDVKDFPGLCAGDAIYLLENSPPKSYDVVAALGCHFVDRKSMRQMARMLNPGGQLILTVPNEELSGSARGELRRTRELTHRYYVAQDPASTSDRYLFVGKKRGQPHRFCHEEEH